MAKLVLASASPRRRELLKQIGVSFEVFPSEVDENISINDPIEYVKELSYMKALWVAEKVSKGIILAADTIVVHRGDILGKPLGKEDARIMLEKLSGDTHEVITGIVLLDMGETKKQVLDQCITKVHFKELTKEVIDNYIATGEPMDKAGSYAIQGYGAVLVEKIQGDYFNVVGLPISKLVDYLPEFNIKVFGG
ncbi:MAG: septum formation inhibitor Maf [Clostridia bacterium]|nr:septum formation inhibitor Maf [Clostridia bacterium]